MNKIKTYEGFFDFFKKKEKSGSISIDQIKDCLYEIMDESRIKSQLNGYRGFGIMADHDLVFKVKRGLSLSTDHDDLMDELFPSRYPPYSYSGEFSIKNGIVATTIKYDPSEISDKEVSDILEECSYRLNSHRCKVSYFIGWGTSEGGSSEKEWTNFMSMIDKTIKRTIYPNRYRNVTIKIVPESNLVFESFGMQRDNCDRCGEPTGGITIMSVFNDDVICMKCKEEEKKDPEYSAASLAEVEAVRRGDTNFKGAFPDYKPLRRR